MVSVKIVTESAPVWQDWGMELNQKVKNKPYLSKVKTIMVKMETWVTSSVTTVTSLQPMSPKGQGYALQISKISIGITGKTEQSNFEYINNELLAVECN